ncbi:MAG TPA: RimK/LysX family protein [Cellvibrionaceae bacterium]
MYRKIFTIGLMLAVCSGCANNYRLVKTTQMEAINQCAMASDHNHQVLLEQQQIVATGLDELLLQLENSHRIIETQQLEVCPDPEIPDTPAATVEITAGTQVVGATEQVHLDSLDLTMDARIDTGILTAVLDARDIVEFERNSENWVRFNLINPATDEAQVVELRSPRKQSMQLRNGQQSARRPVVALPITLGKITQVAEFILTNRRGQDHSILIGRQILRDVMLVDVSRDNIAPVPVDPSTTEDTP